MPHFTKLDVYAKEIPLDDYYLIGVDTASSLSNCYSAIEVFSYRNFEQIAELKIRIGSLTKYGDIVDGVFKYFHNLVGNKIILCIENNSIGKSIIESLLYHVPDFNYIPFIWKPKDKDEFGVNTNAKTKDLMIAFLYELITENPLCIRSSELISQLHTIERNASGLISSKSFTDMFMASAFCAYVRKLTLLEIMPQLSFSCEQLENNLTNHVKLIANLSNPKSALVATPNMFLSEVDYCLSDKVKEESKDLPFYFGVG